MDREKGENQRPLLYEVPPGSQVPPSRLARYQTVNQAVDYNVNEEYKATGALDPGQVARQGAGAAVGAAAVGAAGYAAFHHADSIQNTFGRMTCVTTDI